MLKTSLFFIVFSLPSFLMTSESLAVDLDNFSDETESTESVEESYPQEEELPQVQTKKIDINLQERLIQAERQIEFLLNQKQNASQINHQVPVPENDNIPNYNSIPEYHSIDEPQSVAPEGQSNEHKTFQWIPGSDVCTDCEETYPSYYSDYDGGFLIRPYEKKNTPFELKINGRMQFRYTGFSRDKTSFTDRTGDSRQINNRNDFEIERGRLEFSGFMHNPRLQFYLNLDGDTDDSHNVRVHDFWVNYQFSEAFNLHFGKAFVPGSREWLEGSTRTQLVDRSVATTFFRPDRSIGVWATGDLGRTFHYRAMVGNGVKTSDLKGDQINDSLAYSGSVWAEPFDKFGKGYSDISNHRTLAARFGSSFTFSSEKGEGIFGITIPEKNFIRLTDGTRLTKTGALAPGVTVDKFHYYLLSTDMALKYKGFSLHSEYYFRWLDEFSTDGPTSHDKLYDDGFYVATGYMLKPKKLELAGRFSKIDGIFGDSYSYAGGVNYFFNGTHKNKLTLDVTVLHRNPANNSGPNLRVGDDGLLFRAQYQVAF